MIALSIQLPEYLAGASRRRVLGNRIARANMDSPKDDAVSHQENMRTLALAVVRTEAEAI